MSLRASSLGSYAASGPRNTKPAGGDGGGGVVASGTAVGISSIVCD